MHILITYKLKMELINRNREKVVTSNFRRSRAANSIVSSGIWPKLELIQAFIHVLITCKVNSIHYYLRHLSHYKYMGYFRRSRADNSIVCGPIWPKFELVLEVMHVLVTYKS